MFRFIRKADPQKQTPAVSREATPPPQREPEPVVQAQLDPQATTFQKEQRQVVLDSLDLDVPPALSEEEYLLADEEGERLDQEEVEDNERRQLISMKKLEEIAFALRFLEIEECSQKQAITEQEIQERQTLQTDRRLGEQKIIFGAQTREVLSEQETALKSIFAEEREGFEFISSGFTTSAEDVAREATERVSATKIQRCTRSYLARKELSRLKDEFFKAAMAQRYVRYCLAGHWRRTKEIDIIDRLTVEIHERSLRQEIIGDSRKDWGHLQLRMADEVIQAEIRAWTREKAAQDKFEKNQLESTEWEARKIAVLEEEGAFVHTERTFFAELQQLLEKEEADRQERHRQRLQEEMDLRHALERQQMCSDEEVARTALNKEAERGWWTVTTKAPLSKSKAMRDTIERILREQFEARKAACAEEEDSRITWMSEYDTEQAALEKLLVREKAKALQRQALREEIERLRIEEEADFVIRSFVFTLEHEQWKALEDRGYQARALIEEHEWKVRMDREATERIQLEREEGQPRFDIQAEEANERSALARSFKRCTRNLPYKSILESSQDVTPLGNSRSLANASLSNAAGFALCLSQGTSRSLQKLQSIDERSIKLPRAPPKSRLLPGQLAPHVAAEGVKLPRFTASSRFVTTQGGGTTKKKSGFRERVHNFIMYGTELIVENDTAPVEESDDLVEPEPQPEAAREMPAPLPSPKARPVPPPLAMSLYTERAPRKTYSLSPRSLKSVVSSQHGSEYTPSHHG
eukprot:TRINITY_DN5044_c0_g1_i1.p1 TRINITY_DN5044_c0_g1~~TRINITY_DN5044_c0_g1_i1.p1  ORF type:complete len:767 (-),score=164.58 TRINITY_DN5044_c0_g1_i1:2-2266(-)